MEQRVQLADRLLRSLNPADKRIDEVWAMGEYYFDAGGVPTTVFLSLPVERETEGTSEPSEGGRTRPEVIGGLRFDLDNVTFSMIGYPTTTGGLGLEGGLAYPIGQRMAGAQAGIQWEKGKLPEYTLRVTYGGKNYAYVFEIDKNLAGKFTNLIGVGAAAFSRKYILNGSAAYLWARTNGGSFTDAYQMTLSGGYKFTLLGREWTVYGEIITTRPIRPLGTVEYETRIRLSTEF